MTPLAMLGAPLGAAMWPYHQARPHFPERKCQGLQRPAWAFAQVPRGASDQHAGTFSRRTFHGALGQRGFYFPGEVEVLTKPVPTAEACSAGRTPCLRHLLLLHFGCQLMLMGTYLPGSARRLGVPFEFGHKRKKVCFMLQRKHADFLGGGLFVNTPQGRELVLFCQWCLITQHSLGLFSLK